VHYNPISNVNKRLVDFVLTITPWLKRVPALPTKVLKELIQACRRYGLSPLCATTPYPHREWRRSYVGSRRSAARAEQRASPPAISGAQCSRSHRWEWESYEWHCWHHV